MSQRMRRLAVAALGLGMGVAGVVPAVAGVDEASPLAALDLLGGRGGLLGEGGLLGGLLGGDQGLLTGEGGLFGSDGGIIAGDGDSLTGGGGLLDGLLGVPAVDFGGGEGGVPTIGDGPFLENPRIAEGLLGGEGGLLGGLLGLGSIT
ncbi:MAG: hypothetical protein ACRD0O_11125, partial [Acidimicrobiia bacterium]